MQLEVQTVFDEGPWKWIADTPLPNKFLHHSKSNIHSEIFGHHHHISVKLFNITKIFNVETSLHYVDFSEETHRAEFQSKFPAQIF